MIDQISEKIYYVLLDNGAVGVENKQVIIYGATSIINNILHIGVSIFIGFLFNQVLNVVIFHFFYDNLRRYTGGYHAKSKIKCFIISCLIIVSSITFWKIIPQYAYNIVAISLSLISTVIILIFAPIDNTSKQFDINEKKFFRKKLIKLLLIEITAILLTISKYSIISMAGSTALFFLSLMIISEIINSKKIVELTL